MRKFWSANNRCWIGLTNGTRILFVIRTKEAEAAAGLGTYVKPTDLKKVPDFESRRGAPKNETVESQESAIPNGDVDMWTCKNEFWKLKIKMDSRNEWIPNFK